MGTRIGVEVNLLIPKLAIIATYTTAIATLTMPTASSKVTIGL